MALPKKSSTAVAPSSSSGRRKILKILFGGSLVASILPSLAVIARFISPLPEKIISIIAGNKNDWSEAAPSREIKLGMKDVLVMLNTDGSLTALDLKCTHAGCTVHWLPEQHIFRCPCHGGEYDQNGKVIKGPPPLPLARVQVEINSHGDVVVTDLATS